MWAKSMGWLRNTARTAQPSEAGLTLIECLVAIAVIAASVAVITPAVVLAVATRVQNQRAEQAFQVAQSEVDRVKLIVERGGAYTLNIASDTAATTVDEFSEAPGTPPVPVVPPPDDINDNTYSTTHTAAKPVDLDDDGNDDFAVQIFRTVGDSAGTQPSAFDLGVRVYRADVVENKLASELAIEQAGINFTSGEGQSGSRPLAVIYTTVVKGDRERSLCDYHDFIDSAQGTTTSTPSQC
ncbi:MAG: prepilin-type N-terminal cleavage/methylation domain-containing protein [Cyanobacteria bacterium P01_G01_bin.38]